MNFRARAFAKINVTLRVLGARRDGFHELRTVFQSLSLHDTLVVERAAGPFTIVCSDPQCPEDERNLVWRAAEALARQARRRTLLRDVRIRITKRIPLEAGLGGGSSDAAAALRVLAQAWHLRLPPEVLRELAASLGADVPYFLDGGTALGVERGDLLFPLADLPSTWVVLAVPPFGVSTKDAYAWWDRGAGADRRVRRKSGGLVGADPRVRPKWAETRIGTWADTRVGPCLPRSELRNDLQPPVEAHHPELGRIRRTLDRAGADHAAMSGSGSAVFGLFGVRAAAAAAARRLGAPGRRVILTRTLGRTEYAMRANSR